MSYKWSDDWRYVLKEKNYSCWLRLCECRNTAIDVVEMATYMHKFNTKRTKEECLDRMIEWCSDWNSQFDLFDKINKNYKWYLQRMK